MLFNTADKSRLFPNKRHLLHSKSHLIPKKRLTMALKSCHFMHGAMNGVRAKNFFLSVHRQEELFVVLSLHKPVSNGVHGFDGIHLCDVLAHNPHTVERGFVMQQVVATG